MKRFPLALAALMIAALLVAPPAMTKPKHKGEGHGDADPCAQPFKLGKHSTSRGKGKKVGHHKDEARALACLSRSGAGPERSDFNGDGRTDLAVGVPDENVGTISNAGAVDIVYGGSATLEVGGSQHLTQFLTPATPTTPARGDLPEAEDKFGSALAAGDFNADGFDDLAVGVPFEDVGALADAGIVNVFYGSATGLRQTNPSGTVDVWSQNSAGVPDTVEAGDQFGFALTWGEFGPEAGNIDQNQHDLAIGAPGESVLVNVGGVNVNRSAAGAVNVLYGRSGAGLTGGGQFFTQESAQVPETAEAGDRFGAALTAGDLGGEAHHDLAIGVPFEDVGSAADAGFVNVLFSNGTALSNPGALGVQQSAVFGDSPEAGDTFGSALTARNFDGAGRQDLAVGAPLEDVFVLEDDRTHSDAGSVLVRYNGGAFGHTITQATPDVDDHPEVGDRFGAALAANNFDGGPAGGFSATIDDLAIGVPLEDLLSGGLNVPDTGAVNVVRGSSTGLTGQSDQFLTQDSPDVPDEPGAGDQFGFALSAWDFGGDTRADLAVGVPFEDIGDPIEPSANEIDVGVVDVVYRSGAALDLGQEWKQSDLGRDPSEGGDHFGAVLY